MSLINEMLRDLESRRAAELGKRDLQREVRPLPRGPDGGRKVITLVVAGSLAAALGGAGIWAWNADLLSIRSAVLGQPVAVLQPVGPSAPASSPAAASVSASAEVSPAAVAEVLRLAEGEAPGGLPSQSSAQGLTLSMAESMSLPLPRPGESEIRAKEEPNSQPLAKSSAGAAPQTQPQKPVALVAPSSVPPGNIEKTQILATPRERADAEFRRAQGMLATVGGAPAVVETLQAALRQDPGYSPARQLLLRVFLESRRIDDAIALLQEGLENQPAQVGWAMSLARLQVERGDIAAGERTLSRSRSHAGASPEFLGFHGYLLHRLGQNKDAAEQYLSAARQSPSDGRWWFGLGQALEAEGRSDDARGAYRRAAEAGNLSADLLTLAEQRSR